MTARHTWQRDPRKRSVLASARAHTLRDVAAKRDRMLTFRLTEVGYQVIADRAKVTGQTQADTIRAMLAYAAQHMPPPKPPHPFE